MRADEDKEMLAEMLENHEDPSEIWDGRVARRVIRRECADWLMGLAEWRCFVTLTFREEKAVESAKKLFGFLVRVLNRDLLGNHYTRYVEHSYFSYVLVTEYQQRGVVHFHLLADMPLHFKLIHEFWNERAGFAFTSVVRKANQATWYVAKYVAKNGDYELYRRIGDWEPMMLRHWWKIERKGNIDDGEGSGGGRVGRPRDQSA